MELLAVCPLIDAMASQHNVTSGLLHACSEENVYQLCSTLVQRGLARLDDLYAVFISNKSKQVRYQAGLCKKEHLLFIMASGYISSRHVVTVHHHDIHVSYAA